MTVYRSAQGKPIDMAQLASKNETIRAVGNMNVNARGDVLDSHNKVITDGTKRIKTGYNKTVIKDAPKPSKPIIRQEIPEISEPTELSSEEQELFDDNDEDIKK